MGDFCCRSSTAASTTTGRRGREMKDLGMFLTAAFEQMGSYITGRGRRRYSMSQSYKSNQILSPLRGRESILRSGTPPFRGLFPLSNTMSARAAKIFEERMHGTTTARVLAVTPKMATTFADVITNRIQTPPSVDEYRTSHFPQDENIPGNDAGTSSKTYLSVFELCQLLIYSENTSSRSLQLGFFSSYSLAYSTPAKALEWKTPFTAVNTRTTLPKLCGHCLLIFTNR